MKKNKVNKSKVNNIDKDEQISKLVNKIFYLEKQLSKKENKLDREVIETQNTIKKNRKFNVKAWLLTSCFAIASCVLGIANLVFNIVKAVNN